MDRLLARRSALEERVRRLARQAAGPLFAPPAEPPTVDQLSAGLGDAVLIELIATVEDDALTAVTVRDGEPRLHALGSRDGRPPGARRAAVRAAPARARARCSGAGAGAGRDCGRAGWRPRCSARCVTCWATGRSWWCRPARCGRCRGRCCRPASAVRSRWRRRRRCGCGRQVRGGAGPAGRRVVLVCGPGLEGAKAEIAELAAAYPDAVRLEGPAATVERVQAALDGAGIAHVAAHGVPARRQPAVLRADHVRRPAHRVRPGAAVPGAAARAAAGLPVRRRERCWPGTR